ncbi:MAG: hypothetical protein WC622_08245 [Pedobacter sp.]|jgi:hypothetical protein|uniref:hypothetical protein n=1 Tax=Pedobacter sp. TaxID=1411316 RepID=UPI00356566CC
MENSTPNHTEDPNKSAPPVETNYEAHKDNPGPAPTVNEPDNKGAGQAMKWIIPIIVVVLLIVYFIFFRNNVTK